MTKKICPVCHDGEVSSRDVGRLLKPAEYKACDACVERAWQVGRRLLYGIAPDTGRGGVRFTKPRGTPSEH